MILESGTNTCSLYELCRLGVGISIESIKKELTNLVEEGEDEDEWGCRYGPDNPEELMFIACVRQDSQKRIQRIFSDKGIKPATHYKGRKGHTIKIYLIPGKELYEKFGVKYDR